MEDELDGYEPSDATEFDPADGGQVEEGAPPEDRYIDLSALADKYVRVTVDGEEVEVPVSELPNGYQRQADYTRKTQALAEERRQAEEALRLQRALQMDPKGTLTLLQQALLMQEEPEPEPDPFEDPLERMVNERLAQVEARLAPVLQAEADRQIEATLNSLRTQYGDLVNPQRVIETALQHGGIPLEQAFKLSVADELLARQQAEAAARTALEAEEQQRTAAKRQAQSLMQGSSANPTATAPPSGEPTSLRDAYLMSLREHGF